MTVHAVKLDATGSEATLVESALRRSRDRVSDKLTELFARRRETGYGPLYDLLADYPFREGKGLRPAICFAACGAAGGQPEQALVSATALELYHNAFLVHDDVEDGSEFRRGDVTLFRRHGVPVAINVGDATNVLATGLLLENVEAIGVRKALQVFGEVERMARESAEGQAMELAWISHADYDLADRDYFRMAYKKTCWYTVIAPLRVGVICGSAPGPEAPLEEDLLALNEMGYLAGIAFQIHDDLLNLEADEALYGKEISGDLWEGKRTIMLLHFLRKSSARTRARALRVLNTPRSEKSRTEVKWLHRALVDAGSLEYGRELARDFSLRAIDIEEHRLPFAGDNDDRKFLREMLRYVVRRLK